MIIAKEIEQVRKIQEWDEKGLLLSIEISTAGEIVIRKKTFNEDGEEITPTEFRIPVKVLEAELNQTVHYLNILKFLAKKVLEKDENALKGLAEDTLKIIKTKK